MNMTTFSSLLLLAGGLILTIPPINTGLTEIFRGTPVIQVVLGIMSLIIGVLMLVRKGAFSS